MTPPVAALPDRLLVERLLHRYAAVSLTGHCEHLSAGDRTALHHLVEAARWIDRIYWQQRSESGWQLKQQIDNGTLQIPAALARLVDLGYGPWDVFDDDRPFWGEARRPPGGNFYPVDLTRDEIDRYIAEHPADRQALFDQAAFIRRDGPRLVPRPYTKLFDDELRHVGEALAEASRHVSNGAFGRFLAARAEDLQTGALHRSDALWIEVGDSPIDIAIGPFEVYDDGLLGVKTSYEATVMVRHAMTDRLAEFETLAGDLAPLLPGAVAPRRDRQRIVIGVYDVIYAGGSTNLGAKAIAAMLPNDEHVRRDHGSRLLLFRNVISAKFAPILKPIAERLLSAEHAGLVQEEAFVLHTLLHEMAHALAGSSDPGAHPTPHERLRERYSTIEECRADLVGLVFLEFLAGRGALPPAMVAQAAATFIASSLRVLRFGRDNDYGRAATIILSHLWRDQALVQTGDGRLAVDIDRTLAAVRRLAARVQSIAVDGSHSDAGALIAEHGELPPPIGQLLPRLTGLPIDLEFRFDDSLGG